MSAPLPGGVFHLLTADDEVTSSYGGYVAVCGEVLRAGVLPPSLYPPAGEWNGDPRYCPACVREAVRAQAGERVTALGADQVDGVYTRSGATR